MIAGRSNGARARLPILALAILLLAASGCGSDTLVNIAFGTLTVDTNTTGANQDPNAYNLEVTGPSLNVNQTIGLNDQVVFTVTPGSYSARLTDIADNCAVDTNPFNVTVTAGVTSRVTFLVGCA
ncbi:MAG: hypothetical protein ACE5GX_09230 [Thermoanaerobaculia bacterium]